MGLQRDDEPAAQGLTSDRGLPPSVGLQLSPGTSSRTAQSLVKMHEELVGVATLS
jgi:hypothetical protein